MCWAPIRMNVKGLQNGCPVLCENLNPESKCVPSPIQNLSQVHVHAHILTPSPLLLQSPSRPGFHLQHVKIHSWIFVSGAYDWKGHRELVTGPLLPNREEWTVEINFNYNSPQWAHLFCCFSEGSGLGLAQLLHHLVKQAVSILQQNIWLIIFFQSSWIQNLLSSRGNLLVHNISQQLIITPTIFQKGAGQG